VNSRRRVVVGLMVAASVAAVLVLSGPGPAQEPSASAKPWQQVHHLTTVINSTRCFQLALSGKVVRITDISVDASGPVDVTLRARDTQLNGSFTERPVVGVPLTKMVSDYAGSVKVNALTSFVETVSGSQTSSHSLTNVCATTKSTSVLNVGVIVSGVQVSP
jgi:hypothetical protein